MSVKPVAKRVVVAALAVLLILAVAGRSRVRIFGGENRRSATISVAKLSSAGTPDNCADVIFSTGRTFDAERLKAMGFVVLKSTCAETFSGFVALASCSRSNSEDDTQPTARGGWPATTTLPRSRGTTRITGSASGPVALGRSSHAKRSGLRPRPRANGRLGASPRDRQPDGAHALNGSDRPRGTDP